MTKLFECPYCSHKGSDGWHHMKNHHFEKMEEYHKMIDEQDTQEDPEDSQPVNTIQPLNHGKHVITRRLEFDAGHRVYMHESKCNNIHGHRYVVELSCTGKLDTLGRVIDFGVVKSICGKWLDDNLDHGMMFCDGDPLVEVWSGFAAQQDIGWQKFFVMDKNPTAENIAEMLYYKFGELLEEYDINMQCVTVHETPNCKACYYE